MANIRPSALPPAVSVTNDTAIVVDSGAAVEKATPLQIVDAARPLASQAEAETGADNAKLMTPLRAQQAAAAIIAPALAGKENSISAGTTAQYWRGDKTWQALGSISITGNAATATNAQSNTFTATGNLGAFRLLTINGRGWRFGQESTGATFGRLYWQGTTDGFAATFTPTLFFDTIGALIPGNDNSQTLGGSINRWSVVFAGTGTINTSDEREKTWRGSMTVPERAAALQLKDELGFYQWNDAIAEKGADGARIHFGLRAQRAWAIMEANGLDAARYAFLCYDKWGAQRATKDDEGNILAKSRTAGDRYGVRTDQLALFILAAL